MKKFAKENSETVWRYQVAVAEVYSDPVVKIEVDNAPRFVDGQIRAYAILIAMGHGTKAARKVVLTRYTINRLEK